MPLCPALALAAFVSFAALPTRAGEGPNLAPAGDATPGAVRVLVLAEQLFAMGRDGDDPLVLLTAVRLARSVDTRAATGWEGPASPPEESAPAPGLPHDPGSEAALALALLMAEGDPALAEVAADLAGRQRSRGRVSQGHSALAGGREDSWRSPFFGQSRAELAVIGDGAANLDLEVRDETGATICRETGPADLAYCGFTPAWNGFFTVTVTNRGEAANTYRLLTN